MDQKSEKQNTGHAGQNTGPERLESITLNSGFNQKRNVGSNQPQIHNSLNNGNREPAATRKEEEKKNIYY